MLIARSDMFANSVKPRVLAEHLGSLGFDVRVIESVALGRAGGSGIWRWFPSLRARSLVLYFWDGLQAISRTILHHWSSRATRFINGVCLLWVMNGRGRFLAHTLASESFDLLICESGLDQAVVLHRVASTQLLDLPCPFGDELLFSGKLSAESHRRMRDLEERCLSASDRVSFHWHTYESYVRQNYRANVGWLDCSYGVTKKNVRARFAREPKVVFLGSLEGAWVNVELLERLSERYVIDVWGGPAPRRHRGLRYRGYAPTLDILAEYQIGLVTISDDPLRRLSFSSKQLEYFSYGLPVLVPAWRSDELLASGSLPYTEETFVDQVAILSDGAVWQAKSSRALELAGEFSWDAALRPLTELLCS